MNEDFLSFAVAIVSAVIVAFFASYRLNPYSAITLGVIAILAFASFIPINAATLMPLLAICFSAMIWSIGYIIHKALGDRKQ